MKKILLWMVFALFTAARAASPDAQALYPPELKPVPEEARAAHLAASLLTRYHYKAIPLDDALSAKIFDQYLKSLDSEKLYFTQIDIDHLSGDRVKLDDAILKEDLSVPFEIFNLYERRATQRLAYARTLLKNGFDFQQHESYQYARENVPWPKTEAEVQELWRKRVKNDWLRLKLAGKDEQSIVKILDRRYEYSLKRLTKIKSEDAFQAYMNAYTMAIEPHTNYMGPRAAEDFDISMRLSLVGIGATLSELDEYTTVRELVAGGPASLSGQLNVGDRIVGVAQGESGVMTDILGLRLDDTVALIRGAAGSIVRLDVLPADGGPDGTHKLVTLIRKTITLQDQAAKSSVHSIMHKNATRRIAVISLPSFYEDFAARQNGVQNYKSATRDVAKLLDELKKKKVEGVLMDLRNNGGGSLSEAVELTGLFVGKGPVVQQRNANGVIAVERNTRADIAWDGPMGVLINRDSASASEIFAAAIQDYGRGLIIGERSFGKGTVQTIADLDQIAKNIKPQFGELKMTIAQFFRVNGGTTQLRGVTPDIVFPAFSDAEQFGESSYGNALPWTQIKAADYLPIGDLKEQLPILVTLHKDRVKKDKDFQYLLEDISQSQVLREKNMVSLNEAERRKERDAQEVSQSSRELRLTVRKTARFEQSGNERPVEMSSSHLDDGLQANERNLANELAVEKARKAVKDVLLIEAVNIINDEVAVQNGRVKFAVRGKPASFSKPD